MERYLFNQVTHSSYKVLQYVHPLQQQYIHELIKRAISISQVSALIVFGSSIDRYCTSDSDIDLLIIVEAETITDELEKNIRMKLRKDILKAMDLFVETKESFKDKMKSESLYRQIYQDGLVVYDKYTKKEDV